MSNRRSRDKEKTVQDVLTAARLLFSERGLHGTSIRDIENASGVSKGLIIHHFGTKEKLYAVVQDLLAKEYISTMETQRQNRVNFQETIAATIRNSFKHMKRSNEYRRLSLWSYLEGQERNSELEKRFTTALIDSMRVGQQSGLIRGDIDAILMPFIIRGAIEYWIRKEKLIQDLTTNGEIQGGASDEHLIEALARLFLK
jgi:TetR/AcrR family transcriptional regulator